MVCTAAAAAACVSGVTHMPGHKAILGVLTTACSSGSSLSDDLPLTGALGAPWGYSPHAHCCSLGPAPQQGQGP